MSGLFIASRFIPHDGDRRVIAAGALINGLVRVRAPFKAADSLTAAVIAGRLERELAEAAAEEGR
jgi:hypothetical protein